jgi:flagellar hook protein FlgE
MGLYGVMRTSVSGMDAQSNKLSTVSDNIANVNTTGYKRAAAEFTSLVLQSGSGEYQSGSVSTKIRYAITDPGTTQYTTSSTDLAVMGNGFFLVQNEAGATFLTRAGSFVPDNDGNLVNAAGFYLMGTLPNAPLVANGTAGLIKVNVTKLPGQMTSAEPSTLAAVTANLDVNAAVVAAGSPLAAPYAYTSKTSLVTYDNVGNSVTLDIYMTKTAANTWDIRAYNAADSTGGGFPYSSAALDSDTFTFDVSATGKGALAAASPTALTFTIPGGSAFTLDMSSMTQVAADFQFKANVDGNTASAVDKVEVDTNGTMYMIFESGARLAAYDIPLGTVPSPDNLTPEIGNVYSISSDSGNLQVGRPGSSGLGSIKSDALEQSNADLGTELTNMIEAQRGYTANSKVFQTGADLLDVLVNLKR